LPGGNHAQAGEAGEGKGYSDPPANRRQIKNGDPLPGRHFESFRRD
jgi:hypothetical protein